MTSKEHKKHPDLVRPQGGRFHRNELAMLGAPCSIIQKLGRDLADSLRADMTLGYVDADHSEGASHRTFRAIYTDKINHHQLTFTEEDLTYDYRRIFEGVDGVLVNGNHFQADAQIVIINKKKEESLSRKLDRLTDVKAIVLDEGISDVFPFVEDALQNQQDIPVFSISDTAAITQAVRAHLHKTPPLKGLVFAGGKSVRMGRDKGAIDYHGKPQREFMADILKEFTKETFLSVREEGVVNSNYPLLTDTFLELGPYGGLLSAFRRDPNAAWLAVACDVPLVDREAIDYLVAHRDPSKVATCFNNTQTDFPEPMLAIWEPRAYDKLLQFLGLGYSCPRKVLINSVIRELEVPDPTVLTNVNTPSDYEAVQTLIK